MDFKIEVDIARVHFVNTEKYTVDMIGMNGNKYKDLPFLSLYSKPNSQGQGIYMMPERDSYGIIIKLGHKIVNNMLGADKFVIGFYNPLDENGSYSSNREEINPGDFVAKTVFGNKIIGRTDGSITLLASDQSQMTLYPASGNKKDSWGFDNLLRAIFENLEINTDGGHIHHHVNKKEKTTNLEFEIRNKPLYTENPDVVKGNIGSQGAMGNDEYFTTIEAIETSKKGETKIVRQSLKWKSNGWKEVIWNDSDGKMKAKYVITKEIDRTYTTYDVINGESILKYKENITPKGDVLKERYNTSTEGYYYTEEHSQNGTYKRKTYTGEQDNPLKEEYTINPDGSYNKYNYNPSTGNPYFEETLNNMGLRTIKKYTGGNPNALKTEMTIKDDGSYTKKIYNPAGGVQVYEYKEAVTGITTRKIKDPDGNVVLEETKDNTGKIVTTLGKDNRVDFTLDGNSGDVNVTIKNNANVTVEGNISATVNGNMTATVANAALIDSEDVQLGGSGGNKVLTKNTIMKHMCPIIGTYVPTDPTQTSLTAQNVKAK